MGKTELSGDQIKEKELKKDFNRLIEEYKKENNSKDFLLFDLANANENAHTKVLLWLLNYQEKMNGQYVFLDSFFKKLDVNYKKSYYRITDQEKAIGNKATGFIDLYIEEKEDNCKNGIKIIIENKIYGAADTERQLARYIATIDGIGANYSTITQKNDQFNEWYKLFEEVNGTKKNANDEIEGDCSTLAQKKNKLDEWYTKFKDKNIYVVYLTADGQKEPDTSSLPTKLKTQLRDFYRPLNYDADILPWLEEDVLPNVPYMERGVLLTGVIQYIEYLKEFLSSSKDSVSIQKYFFNRYKNDNNLLQGFRSFLKDLKFLNDIKRDNDEKDTINRLFKEMLKYSENYFFDINNNKDEEWCIHVLLNSIILYKKSWADLDKRKYTIPTLHLVADNNEYLNSGEECVLKWKLEVDHLKDGGNWNHGKTNRFDLEDGLKLKSFVAFEENNIIGMIDEAIGIYSNSPEEKTPNLLLNKVKEKSKEWKNKRYKNRY